MKFLVHQFVLVGFISNFNVKLTRLLISNQNKCYISNLGDINMEVVYILLMNNILGIRFDTFLWYILFLFLQFRLYWLDILHKHHSFHIKDSLEKIRLFQTDTNHFLSTFQCTNMKLFQVDLFFHGINCLILDIGPIKLSQ